MVTNLENFKRRLAAGSVVMPPSKMRFYSSPGIEEILGGRPYCGRGKSIVAAIDMDMAACVVPLGGRIEIITEEADRVIVDLSDLSPRQEERGTPAAIVRGVVAEMAARGYSVDGFMAFVNSAIPVGDGHAPMAAFEMLITEILNDMYLSSMLLIDEKVEICSRAGSGFYGSGGGIRERAGAAYGGLTATDATAEGQFAKKLPLHGGYTVFLTSVPGFTAGAEGETVADLKEAAAMFGKDCLYDVDGAEFFSSIHLAKGRISDRALLRATHFFKEAERVEIAEKALESHNIAKFFETVNAAGDSEKCLVRNFGEDGGRAVSVAAEISAALNPNGAQRLHGEGFTGKLTAIVPDCDAAAYQEKMTEVYGKENVSALKLREIGATRVDSILL